MTGLWRYLEEIETPDDLTVVFKCNGDPLGLAKYYIATEVIRTPDHIFNKWLEPAEELINMRINNQYDSAFDAAEENFKNSLREYRPELPLGYGPV